MSIGAGVTTRLGSRVLEYVSKFEKYDYEDISNIIINDIIDRIMGMSKRNLISRLNEIREACEIAGFIGQVCSACKLVETLYQKASQASENPEEIANAMRRFATLMQRLLAMRKNSIQSLTTILASDLDQDSRVYLSSLSTIVFPILSGIQYRLEEVYVPVKNPFGTGKFIAEELRKRQVPANQIPDTHILWALQNSNAVIGVVIGGTSTGRLIVESGFEPAASIATIVGAKIYLAQPLMSLCSFEEGKLQRTTPGFILTNKNGLSLRLRSIDVIDPEDYDLYIVNENEVRRAERGLVSKRQKALLEVFTDTLNYLTEQF